MTATILRRAAILCVLAMPFPALSAPAGDGGSMPWPRIGESLPQADADTDPRPSGDIPADDRGATRTPAGEDGDIHECVVRGTAQG